MMAVVGSLQLSCELGVYKKHKCNNRFKRLDSLSFHLLNSRNRPIRCLPSRYNVVICRAFLPLKTSEIPVLTTAATTVTRSYNALHGGPFVLQLVPAVGFIVFAVWGLVPLMRHFRKLFCNQSESSWSSSTHCVATYYIRPFLIWTGAMLICRAFDPVALTSQASQAVKQRLLVFVRSLSTVLSIAYCLSSLIQQAQALFLNKNDSKDTTNMGFQLAGNVLYTLVWVAAVSSFLELLGFPTTKWLTAGGFGGLLLTLAGREVFTNFLSSVMIQATRPFVLNDWIQTNIEGYEVSGTVEKVGWWTPTIIRGDDREAIHIPNHKFTVNIVRNLSQKTHWRIKTHLAISHLDVNKINVIVADMRKVLAKNPQVEQRRLHRRVFLENIDPENQALLILISCFVKTSRIEEYFSVKECILVDLLRVISHHRARLATPIRTVQKIHRDIDMENIPFSDTIFTRAAAANTRPFLLIGPTYKSSGDDKPTAQARSVRSTEEQGDNLTTTFTSESKTDIATLAKPDSKTDTEVTEIILDPEEDYKVMGTPISESKEEMKVATGSSELKNYAKSETLGGNGIPATLSPDFSNPAIASKLPNLEDHGSAHSSSVQKISSKQLKKVSSVDAQQKIRVDDAPGSASSTQSDLKADSEAAEVTLDSEADDKVTGTPVSEIEEVAVATSSSELNQQKSEPKGGTGVAFTSPPDSTHPKIASNLPNLNTRRKRLNTVSSDDAQQSSMVDEAPVTASASALSSMSSLEDLHSVQLGSEDSTIHGAALKKPPVCDTDNNSSKGVPSNTLLGKQEGKRSSVLPPPLTSRSSLEDNIVLGMALEGSKRTLPIEEGNSSRTSADTKELIVRCNVCGSTFSGKDTKDNQVLTGLGDQREQKVDQ